MLVIASAVAFAALCYTVTQERRNFIMTGIKGSRLGLRYGNKVYAFGIGE